jgi:type II secretory ATPase GspE/PulE/Tfp pilus assembly ATPase PilB-like protein
VSKPSWQDAQFVCESGFVAAGRGSERLAEYEALASRIPAIVDSLLAQAVAMGASDIHLEHGDLLRVRFRRNGQLFLAAQFGAPQASLITGRLKALSGMPLESIKRPVDSSLAFASGGATRHARVSLIPLVDGEKIVVRLLDESLLPSMGRLGMDDGDIELYLSLLERPGLCLIAGPAGAGKTATLYASLLHLAKHGANVVSMEDPVETVLRGVTQIQICRQSGFDFEKAMGGIMRQDPDVIAVGEIRDKEASQVAVRAALTGRTVLASIHAYDAVGAAYRLVELGTPASLAASSVTTCVAQRLVMLACESDGIRTGIFEILPLAAALRNALAAGVSLEELRRLRASDERPSLRERGLFMVARGLATQEEIDRVLGTGEPTV